MKEIKKEQNKFERVYNYNYNYNYNCVLELTIKVIKERKRIKDERRLLYNIWMMMVIYVQ